jgi:hypothetical protein
VVAVLGIGALMARQAAILAENLPGYAPPSPRSWRGCRRGAGWSTDHGRDERDRGRQAPGRGAGDASGASAAPPGDLPAPPRAARGGAAAEAAGAERQAPTPVVIREPDPTTLETLQRLAGPLLHPLATAGIVLVLVIFILLYRAGPARPDDPPGRRARPAPHHGGDGRRGLPPLALLPGAGGA